MKSRIILYADEGKILTNGEIFGKQIYLGDGDKPLNYREITDEEYKAEVEKSEEIENEQ